MEGEVKEEREREARVHQVIPEIHFVPCLPQEQSVFHYMQYNQQLDSDRRRLCIENLSGMYNLSCTQLLALANNAASSSSVGAASFPSYGADSQIYMDSWVNSWKMESNPWSLSPGSVLGTNTGIAGETTMENPQYDEPTSQKFICDLNLTPEEIVSPRPRPTQPDFSPISLDTPGKRLPETDQKPRDTTEMSFRETKSPAGEKKRKRARDVNKAAQVETPPQISKKRKKIRGKVVREGTTIRSASKSAGKKASATGSAAKASATASAAKTSEENMYSRPRRSCRKSLKFDDVFQEEEDGYCGLTFTSEGHIGISVGGKIIPDATMGVFGNIPKRRRQSKSSSTEETLEEDPAGRNMTTRDRTVSLSMSQNMFFLQFPNVQRKRRTDGSIYASSETARDSLCSTLSLVSKMQTVVARKKRSNRDPIASQLNTKMLHLQWRRQNYTGTDPIDTWEQNYPPDAIAKLLEELDITRESPCLPQSRETAVVLHQKALRELEAAIRYRREGSIIPYPDQKNQPPKVLLDDETSRVWKLLMVSIDSEGIDGSDEDKQKWWEEERNVFHGRASSFIARMRLVQGDRRFSPWKGSVVDSVIGVFLTQNVTDHSSSSAFMDLAAEFPISWNAIKGSCHEELESSVTDETVMTLDPGSAVATPRIRNPTCIIIDEIDDDDDDTDAVCSHETSKASDISIRSTNQSKTMLLDPPTNSFETHFDQRIATVSTTSTCSELNLNEAPLEVENCDAFGNNVDEGRLVQPMSNRQQELKSTVQAQDQEKNTRTDSYMKKRKNVKKPRKAKSAKKKPTPKESFDWDSLRKQAESGGQKRERTKRTMDTVDWDALRSTNVHNIADIIRKRGMNNMLASRIKAFLNRLVQDHGGIDLEWLRDVPPDKAKEFLLNINGLGLKSVECVRLLSLHQIAFPVDTNVGRIAVRLGWVPLQPLPDEVQMHLLDLYPVLESVQKYLWPRLCKLDQKTLYELHYHMITFGKVFCTKKKPNCKACPMKAECRHYASAHASARLALPESEEGNTVTIHERRYKSKHAVVNFRQSLFLTHDKEQEAKRSQNCEPIIEEPVTPEPECAEYDIEDYPCYNNDEILTNFEGGTSKDPWENNDDIPTIMLNKEDDIAKDLVVLSTQAASIPRQAASIPRHKLKNKETLRTEHLVFELPDSHPILAGFEERELDDEYPYLLAIWTPGETANSSQPPKQRCVFHKRNTLCHEKTCFPCNNIREEKSQIVRGTILIPCRTAMRGSFPLNGTYFQTNEVFADHGSSVNPIIVPREWIWNLPRRIAYFGSSVTASFRGLPVEAIRYGFWRGYVCVRGFDRKNRKPKTLMKRLHCPPRNKNHEDDY